MVKFSVIIPAYNSDKYLGSAIESVLKQTYSNYEIIVVDDGSTDGTGLVAKEFSSKIKYVHKNNGGVASARNEGIREANGKYIAFLDSDDLWAANKLELTVKTINSDPTAGIIYSDMYCIDELGNVMSMGTGEEYCDKRKLLFNNNIFTSTVTVRKDCFDACGVFYEEYESPAGVEDWDMWLRISEKYPFQYINNPTTYYRVHGGSTFNSNIEKVNRDIIKTLERTFKRNEYPRELVLRVYSCHYKYNGRRLMKNLDLCGARREFIASIKNNWKAVDSYLLLIATMLGQRLCKMVVKCGRAINGQRS